MKKIWIIIAASFIVIGAIIFTGVMTMLKWDFSKLSTEKYQTVNHSVTENFDSISIDGSTAKINFVLSDENKVECFENIKTPYSVAVKNGTLSIIENDNRKWYDYIGINFNTPRLTVYLSKTQFDSLNIKDTTGNVNIPADFLFKTADVELSTGNVKYFACTTESVDISVSTGDITVENVTSKDVSLKSSTGDMYVSGLVCTGDFSTKVSTGKIKLNNITCKTLASSGDTGWISLADVIAKDSISIERSTGDVKFDKCDADEISVTTDTGDVSGSLLSEKVFVTKTSTGKISVPQTVSGGKCEIKTTTGDIKIILE